MKKYPNWGVILALALVSRMVCQGQTFTGVNPNAGPALTVTGTVYDSAGAPAPGVVVIMVPQTVGQNEPIKSDASGKYTLQWQVRPAARGLGGAAPVYSLVARDLEHNFVASQAIDETTASLDLHLKPGLTISAKVEDANGKPITNATGSLIIYSPSGAGASIDRLPVSADEAGRIQFAALPQGFRYSPTIRAPGYGPSKPMTIQAENTQSTRYDLPTVVLALANLKLAGQVLGADGQPVAAARVFVSGPGQPTTNFQSDASGHFALDVCEGAVTISASVAGASGNARTVGGDTNVVLRLNNVAAANANGISIISGAAARTGQVITGTVFDPSGAPVPGVALRVMPTGGLNQEFKSEAGGKFAISWQPIQVGGGAAGPAFEYSLVASDLEHNLAAITSIDEKTTNMDVHLQAGLTISGKVQDPSGAPVKNAMIQLSMTAGRVSGPLGQQPVTADAQGAFSIGALPQGQRYMLTVTATGYGRANAQAQPDQTQTASLQLPPFTLRPANLKLEGKVVDEGDNPVSGAQVRTIGTDQPTDVTTSDSTGHFVFNHVCEGLVRVSAMKSGMSGGGIAQGNVQAQGGDLNVVVKLAVNQAVGGLAGGPAGRQAPPRVSLAKEQTWTWTALGHWPQRHRTAVMTLLCLQLTVCLAGAGVILWLTRARPG